MADFVKSLNNIPDNFTGPFDPQQMYKATGNERHLRHNAITADELCQCEDEGGSGVDNQAPSAISYFPRIGDPVSGNPASLSFARICFDEIVQKGAGTIQLLQPAGNPLMVWDVASSQDVNVIQGGICVLLTGIPNFITPGEHQIVISSGAIKDLSDNDFTQVTAWTFLVPDQQAPFWITFNPGNTEVSAGSISQLVATLDEAIIEGSGVATLYEDGVAIKTWTMGSGTDYTISVNELSLTGFSLNPDSTYHIEAPAGFVTDSSGNPAPSIDGPTDWTFTTVSQVATGEFNDDFSDDFA